MRLPIGWLLGAVVVGFVGVFALGQMILNPHVPLIARAQFDHVRITPNADGQDDATTFRYELARNATVSLILEAQDGTRYAFREGESRIKGEYRVLFSGVVNGYLLPDETVLGVVERRLIPNGVYTWTLSATEAGASPQVVTGTLEIAESDSTLPLLSSFTVAPTTFSPNQDGIEDRVEINVYLEKEASLRLFLLDDVGREIAISARKEGRKPGEAGRHIFDYEGGIDLGADPPKDGTYEVIAVVQDAVGQRIRHSALLTIASGGKPLAEIVPQSVGVDVIFETRPYEDRFYSGFDTLGDFVEEPNSTASLAYAPVTMQVGDLLVFKLTVENYNDVPIRTSFPPPGTVYQQDQVAASLGAFEESGAWRVGIQCETSTTSFPYRWALGTPETLLTQIDPKTGKTYYYLPPKARSVVWGAIRLTNIEKRQNPQTCWAGLIHEDVEISLRNSYVGAREIELVDPNASANDE